MSDTATAASEGLEAGAIRKATWRLIPFVMLLYFVAFLDRINVGFAALTMNKDIGLTPQMFGLGSGIFFLGYLVFEVPSTVILHRVGARFWIGRVMLCLLYTSGEDVADRAVDLRLAEVEHELLQSHPGPGEGAGFERPTEPVQQRGLGAPGLHPAA